MKMSSRERKAYNEGRRLGYAEGYAKGITEANPFTGFINAIHRLADSAKVLRKNYKEGEVE